MVAQVSHRLEVDFHHLQLSRFRNKELGHHPHAGAHLEDGQVGAGIYGVGNALRYAKVGQEVLSEKLFGPYFHHNYCKDTTKLIIKN